MPPCKIETVRQPAGRSGFQVNYVYKLVFLGRHTSLPNRAD